jgi:hypothetical protein
VTARDEALTAGWEAWLKSDTIRGAVEAAVLAAEPIIRADERAERGLANEPQGLALAEMLLSVSRSTKAMERDRLLRRLDALPHRVIDGESMFVCEQVLNLLDDEGSER